MLQAMWKYHDAQLAKELGLLVVDAGHFGTESIVASGLRDYLLGKDISVPVKALQNRMISFSYNIAFSCNK